MSTNTDNYKKEYSDKGFWNKIEKWSGKLGYELVHQSLFLYYSMSDPQVPVATKAHVIGALGYLIFPIDLIPDITPGIGHLDDAGVIFSAYCNAQIYASPETRRKAKAKADEIFGRN